MNIPSTLKIGGKVYAVTVTDKLYMGTSGYSGEILYNDLESHIVPNAQAKMEADFIHEMIHGIYDHLGYSDHDEKKVDELANALYAVIVDNPDIFREESEAQSCC